MTVNTTASEFDPERLDRALRNLAQTALWAEDHFIMGEFAEGEERLKQAAIALRAAQTELKFK
jgi:hypothetical protein